MASSTAYHESLEKLSAKTQDLHRALVSVQEELEAVDWYRQRADACEDDELRAILLHNASEEIEHASMLLEWLRRHDDDFSEQFSTYLFTKKSVLEVEEEKEAQEAVGESAGADTAPEPAGLTVGSMKEA